MKMDQVAYYCATVQSADYIKNLFGLSNAEWIIDTVTADSCVVGQAINARNVAHLQFCYALDIELEIIRYISGPHWHARTLQREPFISHLGIHLDDGDDFPNIGGQKLCRLVQETKTVKHTSEYLTTGLGRGRKYHYKIFEISPNTYIKYIKRIRDEEVEYQTALARTKDHLANFDGKPETFLTCPTCDMPNVCRMEKHCDKTGNGYR